MLGQGFTLKKYCGKFCIKFKFDIKYTLQRFKSINSTVSMKIIKDGCKL